MKRITNLFFISIASLLLFGCSTVTTEIISEPPGAHIEVDSNYVGTTPVTVTLEQDGLGYLSDTIVVKALPVIDGQYTQTKILHWEDPVPKTLYFQMNLVPANSAKESK